MKAPSPGRASEVSRPATTTAHPPKSHRTTWQLKTEKIKHSGHPGHSVLIFRNNGRRTRLRGFAAPECALHHTASCHWYPSPFSRILYLTSPPSPLFHSRSHTHMHAHTYTHAYCASSSAEPSSRRKVAVAPRAAPVRFVRQDTEKERRGGEVRTTIFELSVMERRRNSRRGHGGAGERSQVAFLAPRCPGAVCYIPSSPAWARPRPCPRVGRRVAQVVVASRAARCAAWGPGRVETVNTPVDERLRKPG